MSPDYNYHYHVNVIWDVRRHTDADFFWDKLCSDNLQSFGLPGDRYITRSYWYISKMTWSFKSEQDALLFKLKNSEYVSN